MLCLSLAKEPWWIKPIPKHSEDILPSSYVCVFQAISLQQQIMAKYFYFHMLMFKCNYLGADSK